MARLGVVIVSVVSLVGCGGDDLPTTKDSSATTALRAGAEAVRSAKTVRASFKVKLSEGGLLTGKAETVVDLATSFSYTFRNDMVPTSDIDGTAVAEADRAYLRSSRWKPPAGKQWFEVGRSAGGKLDEPVQGDWLAVAMSWLWDPSFLLDQGLSEVERIESAVDASVPGATVRYDVDVFVEHERLGQELTAWAKQTGGSTFGVVLWTDEDNRPVRLKVKSSTAYMLFDADVTFTDYGAPVQVIVPPASKVAPVR
ncbi:hypothetical protein [Micromonospora sp. DT31]|uniref:hypothetical protein n=1 Tax=Micromonospora sp. DT31 TaxID=3393434 RepID=UPI003CF8084A